MPEYDVIIRDGMIYDGSGGAPFAGDVAIAGETIAAVGNLSDAQAKREIRADGLAVTPGFVNMLSWACESLIMDGRGQSDLRQGVTLEVMGEGFSFGPYSEAMKAELHRRMEKSAYQYTIEWTTLGEYLEYLARRGVATNVASFVGAATLRIHELGFSERPPTAEELARMCDLAREAMREGAVGLATALIYPPGSFARTEELIALAAAVGEYGGMYISHLRSEATALLDALDEFMTILDQGELRGHLYHLKAAGRANWPKMDTLIERVEAARRGGTEVTADMYTYPAGATGLTACVPPWAQEGGREAMIARFRDPETRARILDEMDKDARDWENMRIAAGTADNILLGGFENPELRPLTGKTLAEVCAMRGTPPEETILNLIDEDGTRVEAVYFTISEDNMRKQIALPWVALCSDEQSVSPEGIFLGWNPHPRAYGSFARLFAKYVREEKVIPFEEAVRRLTSLPASILRIEGRGWLKPGYFADVVVLDPATIQDNATFQAPHQLATGVSHVLVNGVPVLADGEPTGATPGQVVRGPGWTGRAKQ